MTERSTHGNGPQVGLLALQAAAYREVPAYPLDVLGAESEGMIGYLLQTSRSGSWLSSPCSSAVEVDLGTSRPWSIARTTPEQIRALALPPGAESTGGLAAIGALEQAAERLAGTAGTVVTDE